jgi:PAS domain S-box-containing protein
MPSDEARGDMPEDRSPKTEELFRFMVESVKDYAIFATDGGGDVVSWNTGAERIFGYTEEEIVGRNASVLFTPEDIEIGAHEWELETAATEGRAEDERWHLRKDGSRFWAGGIVTPLRDEAGNLRGFVKVARDNTRRKLKEEQLRTSETRTRALIEQSPFSIQILSPDGRTLMVNRAWEELWGITLDQLDGYNMLEDQQLVLKGVMPYIRKGFAGEAATIPAIMYDPSETIPERTAHTDLGRWVRAFIYPLKDERGSVREVVLMHEDITERKRAEDALRESEERHRVIAETASDAIITIDEDSTILFVNRAAEQIFGHRIEELLGRRLTVLMPEYLRHLHRAGIKRYLETGQRHIAWESVELPGLHKSGREISLELSFGEFSGGGKHLFTGIARDITERKGAQLRQAIQYAVTRVLAEAATLTEATVRILQTICEGFNWSLGAFWLIDRKEDVLRCVELWHPSSVQVVEFEKDSRERRLPKGVGLPGRVWQAAAPVWIANVTEDGNFPRALSASKEGLYSACAFPIILGGEVLGVMEFFSREIREPEQALLDMMMTVGSQMGLFIERQRAEEERTELLVREQEARRQAEHANSLKDEFLATASHELRTPLTAIIGWAHLLRTGQLDAKATVRALETIDRNAKAQVRLTDDILDVSRIITGKLHLEIRPVELASLTESVVESMRPAAEARRIKLQLLIDSTVGVVSGDPDRLRQIVWNLVSNAIKFTPRGGRVQVRLERIDSRVELTVSDTGKGISPEFLPHVFDRFRQADATTTRAYGGLGLGLAIVRQLVEMHGGTAHVESEGEGHGSTFTVTLPLLPVRRESSGSTYRAAGSDGGTSLECPPELHDLRLLVVEDEEDAREMLVTVLEKCGAEVAAAGSVREALEEFERSRPDVLISDIGMADEDGYQLIRMIRALPDNQGGRTPAVALTAYARPEDRMRSLLAGFQVHVTKPVDANELIAVVASQAGRTGKN